MRRADSRQSQCLGWKRLSRLRRRSWKTSCVPPYFSGTVKLSTGGMEAVLASHPDVAECAVIGIRDALKGEQPCGFVVLKSGVTREPAEIERELVASIRDRIGPVAAFKLALTVARLPKTRSGKILRGTMKKIADGEAWTMPPTIDDSGVLDEIGESLKGRGIGA